MDNLLLTKSGKISYIMHTLVRGYNTVMSPKLKLFLYFPGNLFHIDFGYILGRDPKPLPPPMKLSKEMVRDCEHLEHFSRIILILLKLSDLSLSISMR